MSYFFRDQSSIKIGQYIDKNALIILPVGTTEEHGRHLPVDTDARIAEAYGVGLAEALKDEFPLLVMNTVCYGYSVAILKQWPGTIVVGTRTFMDTIFDISKSIFDMGFNKLCLLDAHGHHGAPLTTVSRELMDACGKALSIVSPAVMSKEAFVKVRKSVQGGAIHGGEWETSLVLCLNPEVVDMSEAVDCDIMKYNSEFVAGDSFTGSQKVGWSTWMIQASKTGIYGDPTVATAATGKIIYEAAVENGARFLREFVSVPDADVGSLL